MGLEDWLKSEKSALFRDVMLVRDAVKHIWERPVHRHYTDHSLKHSERVIKKLDGLTEGIMSSSNPLSATEVFILLAAAYLHDIGMQDERQKTDKEWIREHHHELTREMIFEYLEERGDFIELGLPRRDVVIGECVARIAEAHRQVELNQDQFENVPHGKITIRLRLLAALLRFADELDIDHQRVDMDMLKLMQVSSDSRLHWHLCDYVSAVQIENEYITICYRFPRGYDHYARFVKPLVDRKIRAEFKELEDIFRRNGVKAAISQRADVRYFDRLTPLSSEVEEAAKEQLARLDQEVIERIYEGIEGILVPPSDPVDLEIVRGR